MNNFKIRKIPVYFKTVVKQKHPFLFLAANFMIITGLNKYKKFKFDGYKIAFSKSAMCLNIFMDHDDRAEESVFLKDVLRKDDTVIDVGANIGTLTIPAALYCSNGRVISIEAHPNTFEFLKENIALNNINNITVINKAVGNKEGVVNFSDISSDDQNKISTDGGGINVPLVPLDNLLPEYGVDEIALLKIDVEGFEKFVLEGAVAVLKKTKAIYLEVWQKSFDYYNYTFEELFDLLNKEGFAIYAFSKSNTITRVDRTFSTLVCQNVLAVKDIEWFKARTGYPVIN